MSAKVGNCINKRIIIFISWDSSIDENKIDNILSDLNKEITYSIPKLLKPLTYIQDEENELLSYMEMGAFNPETRRLIEIGIPRETSVKLFQMIKSNKENVVIDESVNDKLLFKFISEHINQLNYWERIQIEDLIS